MIRETACALVPLALSVAPPCSANDAKDGPLVVARAIGAAPTERVVRYVAQNARATEYLIEDRKDLQRLTIAQFAEMHCGSLQLGYLSELSGANSLPALDPDARLADSGMPRIWPACLYVAEGKKKEAIYTVKWGDTLTGIHQKFTGSGTPSINMLNAFYAESRINVAQALDLKPGQEVVVPRMTAATELFPKGDPTQFAENLAAVAGEAIVVDANPPPAGSIIEPVRFGEGGAIQNSFRACQPGDTPGVYPFNAGDIEAAYAAAKASGVRQENVTAVVVDNGFFGVKCSGSRCPERDVAGALMHDARFPRSLFDQRNFGRWGGLGPRLVGTDIDPLNYLNYVAPKRFYGAADVNAESGHGTHVAGLVLGGPEFLTRRIAFENQNAPWLRLVIANLSGGKAQLGSASARNLAAMLGLVHGFKIINMSIAFDGALDPTTAKTLVSTFREDPQSLVIAAAGNDGKSLEGDDQEYFPARLGGVESDTVLTVASIDGPVAGKQRLSEFSNRSSRYVDLAAPGCQIESWLDADQQALKESGTSQAAPVVSFAASLLRSLWSVSAVDLKNRLLYSGDLLIDPDDRKVIRSMSQLNIEKALGFPWDRVTFSAGGRQRTLLGELSLVQGLYCAGLGPVKSSRLRAFKRAEDGRLAIFRADSNDKLDICWGGSEPGASVSLSPNFELSGGRFVETGPDVLSVLTDDVVEVVRAN